MSKTAIAAALSIIEKSRTSLIGSVDEDGFPNVKAMLRPRERDGLKTVFFSTNTSSMRVAQFLKNEKASLYFYDPDYFRGIMLKGSMEVITEQSIKERIWRDGDTMYYKKGVTDPDYCVLKFTATSGRLYGDFKSKTFRIE